MDKHPLPIALALEWFLASGERTRERLDGLIDHFSAQYFPVTNEHREAAYTHCAQG